MGEPSIVHLRQRMQQVYENQNQALKIGRRARQDMVSQYVVCVWQLRGPLVRSFLVLCTSVTNASRCWLYVVAVRYHPRRVAKFISRHMARIAEALQPSGQDEL